jgi:hypothetical protein
METIEDDEPVNKNIAPRNKNHVLELADGSDDDLPPGVNLVPVKKVS